MKAVTTTLPPIYVLHVRQGYDERALHIETMMERLGLTFEYILDGDKADLDQETLQRWFSGSMRQIQSATSCAYKHLIACMLILERQLAGALILEDDIVLSDNYATVAAATIAELPDDSAAIISYEDTRLRFVPRSRRRPGKYLYEGDRDRFTGALYVNASAARTILENAAAGDLDCPIDIFHRRLLDKGLLKYYWSHPCTASQGSFNGLFSTSISGNHSTVLLWKLKRIYKRLLYNLR